MTPLLECTCGKQYFYSAEIVQAGGDVVLEAGGLVFVCACGARWTEDYLWTKRDLREETK